MGCEENRKLFWKNTLTKLTGKIKNYDYVGFDVETFGDSNEFMSGGFFYYKDKKECFEYFYDRDEMIEFILRREFANRYIVATNLGFDMSVLFWGSKYWNDIKLVTRGSDILMCVYDLGNKHGKIRFIDTFNFAGFSVEKLGGIIGEFKLEKPEWLGLRKPVNDEEWGHLKRYNRMDCKITCDFMYFLQKGINEAGGNIKVTIASTSMDVYRRGHLPMILTKENFILKDNTIKDFIFKAYYGGRTEVFKRGTFSNLNYYDVNSLYPSVMRRLFPVPQSVMKVYTPNISYILSYEGVTEAIVTTPSNLKIPLLPLKYKNKLIFPKGKFKGSWNNVELRKALSLGYDVIPLKQIIYKQTFYPFKSYVETFYNKRLEAKAQGSNMELIYKLLLNSLYGKFAQKTRQMVKIIDYDHLSPEEQFKYMKDDFNDNVEREYKSGHIIMERTKSEFDGVFSMPILSSYTTSYARLLMYEYMEKYDVIYSDTDSIVINDSINEVSKALGDMKLEGHIDKAIFVKPKFYMMDDVVKVKGVNRCTLDDFETFLDGGSVSKMKFSKLRESVRRDMKPNTKMMVTKSLDLEDTKRDWRGKFFSRMGEQDSDPLEFDFDGTDNILLTQSVKDVIDFNLEVSVKNYLSVNKHLLRHFKGRISEVRRVMVDVLNRGVDLDQVDWLSMSNDKPLSEYMSDFFSVEGV